MGEAKSVKFGATGAVTVNETEVVWVRLPEMPVMVTVAVPLVAVLLAVNVSTLVLVAGFVPNDAVTPVGKPDADSVTLPVKPLVGVIVMVLVPPVPPCVIVALVGEAEMVKLGVGDIAARALIRLAPFGLPQPVSKS